MFGSSNKQKKETGTSPRPAQSSNALNSLVQGTVVEGKLKATNDIRVDGTIKGELHCDAKVIIGPTGVIEGTVKCQNAMIEGSFNGILDVRELLNIREKAKVVGEVSYGKLNVQSGAVISGSYTLAGEKTNGKSGHSNDAKGNTSSQNIAHKAKVTAN